MTAPPRTVPAEPTEEMRVVRLFDAMLAEEKREGVHVYTAAAWFDVARKAVRFLRDFAAAPPPPEDRLLAEVVELMARAAGTLTAVGMWSDSPRFEQRAQELRDMVSRLRAAQQPTEEGGE